MNVAEMNVSKEQAQAALREYKAHRSLYDQRDWEIERIYRAIAKGDQVISVVNAIRQAGQDSMGYPRLAICQAHAIHCVCHLYRYGSPSYITFGIDDGSYDGVGKVKIPWPGLGDARASRVVSQLPRIPPQHRPSANKLPGYHMLWEAEWRNEPPADPYLLKRIGKDAWVVLAAWGLTEVELSVLRARAPQ